ncbi:hypothetical protein SA2016_4142 (plasmid) [Sinomonas atrocyanea]|uniref:Uncharacterized protein n=2 Tax=Bacteria TaxID=2 RepID=A0A127A7P4_9MICC|nr:hypothetical protein [Sinomonas atrocyanea]AMM34794.1 hypothetical protein SA2016_4142 [Sinomonas atrocyanea]GEB64629.1 hypothetical protein SAT01_20770 [Sinomonas atrocyanea]GGG72163.1 hypothetical protein GCM10007172_25730 [Sinomonas atrocyanea]
MPECRVLHCPNSSSDVFTYNFAPLQQAPVCHAHLRRLMGGEMWLLDSRTHYLRMGADVPPKVVAHHVAKTFDGRNMIELDVETTHPQDGTRNLSLVLDPKSAEDLRKNLGFMLGKGEAQHP